MKARYWSASAKNGNLGEIDLLLARQRQQKIERTLEALDVDHERRLVGGALGKLGFELVSVASSASHAEPAAGAQAPAMSLKNSARARGEIDRRRRLAQRQRGVGPARGLARELGRRRGHREHFVHLAVAMQHHIAARRDRRLRALGQRAGQRAHGEIVAHQEPRKPNRIANHVTHYSGRSGGRRDRVEGCKHNMRGHPQRQAGERPECREIGRFERRAVGTDDRRAFRGCRRWRGRGRAYA